MRSFSQYADCRKPWWAPPWWLFVPAWMLFYVMIFISFGRVGYEYILGAVPGGVAFPFLLNFLLNFAFINIQFQWNTFALASLDIIAILLSLAWCFAVIYPYIPWIVVVNLPYFAWVCFAIVLQFALVVMNRPQQAVKRAYASHA